MGFWHWGRMPASVPATGESKKNKKVSTALGSHRAGKGDKSVYSKSEVWIEFYQRSKQCCWNKQKVSQTEPVKEVFSGVLRCY